MIREIIKMFKYDEYELPIISTTRTSGLTNMNQLIDVSANDIFSFGESSSETEQVKITFPSIEKYKGKIKDF